jgi:hypothetical protein
MKGREKEKKSLKHIYTFITSTAGVVDYRKESFHALACIYIYVVIVINNDIIMMKMEK